MSILGVFAEMGSAVPSDSTVSEASSGYSGRFNSAFARCMVRLYANSSYADSAAFASTADLWLHMEVSQNGAFNTDSTQISTIEFLSSGTAKVRMTTASPVGGDAAGVWNMQYYNGAAWVAAGSFTAPINTLQTIDIHIVCNTASGSLKLYLAGTLRGDSGTIDLSAITGITSVRPVAKQGVSETYYSQGVVADESTIGWRLKTVAATGAGATTDWTGGFTEIDEITYDDTDFVNSSVVNQVELFSHSATIPTGYTVRAVAVTARAKRGASGPQNLQLALRSAGTTYFSSSKALDVGYGAFVNIWETDPATSAAFTASAATAVQFGVKSIT